MPLNFTPQRLPTAQLCHHNSGILRKAYCFLRTQILTSPANPRPPVLLMKLLVNLLPLLLAINRRQHIPGVLIRGLQIALGQENSHLKFTCPTLVRPPVP